MSKIVDLESIRQRSREEVEKKAYEEYGVVKLGEDSYIVPSNVVKTKDILTEFIDSDFYKNDALRKAIGQFEVDNGDYISVSCKVILGENEKVLEVVDITNEEIIDITVNSSLDYEEREKLVNMIAYIHRNKELTITFYLHYNFELIEQLVSE